MPVLLCSHTDCPVSREVGVLYFTDNGHQTWYCSEHRGPTEFLPKPGFKDCQFCKDEVTDKDVFRHNGGRLYHVDCLIRLLLDTIHDLKNPLTGEVEDDSIPNAFKKLYGALREQARLVNRIHQNRFHRDLMYGTKKYPRMGMYKGHVGVTWGKATEIAAKCVRDAVKELERLTNGT